MWRCRRPLRPEILCLDLGTRTVEPFELADCSLLGRNSSGSSPTDSILWLEHPRAWAHTSTERVSTYDLTRGSALARVAEGKGAEGPNVSKAHGNHHRTGGFETPQVPPRAPYPVGARAGTKMQPRPYRYPKQPYHSRVGVARRAFPPGERTIELAVVDWRSRHQERSTH